MTGVQTCALPICRAAAERVRAERAAAERAAAERVRAGRAAVERAAAERVAAERAAAERDRFYYELARQHNIAMLLERAEMAIFERRRAAWRARQQEIAVRRIARSARVPLEAWRARQQEIAVRRIARSARVPLEARLCYRTGANAIPLGSRK